MNAMQAQAALAGKPNVLRILIPVAAIVALGAWFYVAPEGALGKLDAIGYAVCHRIEARSFHVGGRQLPLCARCTGEFNAAAIALTFQFFISGKRARLPRRSIMAVLVLFFLAFAVDGSNSFLYLLRQTSGGALEQFPNLYVPNNTLRLFTGSGMGLALAIILYPVVNQTLWREPDERPALGWKSFGILLAITLLTDLLILTEHPLILYPVAYFSVLGVLALLVMVFSTLWITIMRQDNTFQNAGELWLPAAAGLTLALLMVVGIDLFRYRLTGTWSGFPGLTG